MYVPTTPEAAERRYAKLNFGRFRSNREKRNAKRASANHRRAEERKGGTNTKQED